MEFEEFMQANGGKVLDIGPAQMVIIDGDVSNYIHDGTFSIPGLKIDGVDIVSNSEAKAIKQSSQDNAEVDEPDSKDIASTPVPGIKGMSMEPMGSEREPRLLNKGAVNRTGKSKVFDYEDVSDAATVTEAGTIDVVYNISVPTSMKKKIQTAVDFVSAALKKQGLSWVAKTTLYINTVNHEPGGDLVGRYWPSHDYLELSDEDTGYIRHTLTHEFGHRFHYQCLGWTQFDASIKSAYETYINATTGKFFPTKYAKLDYREWFAESWTYWLFNRFSGYTHADWLIELIRKHNR
jgi:hypothetical protein